MDLIRRVVIFLGITLIAIVVTYFVAFNDFETETLPILSPRDINPELVDSSLHNRGIGTEGIYHQISPFNLVDQHGLEVTENVIDNKVVVVDFFFVSCGSICPIMTKNLKRVHDFYKKNHNVLILSHTVWPEMDSVTVLNNYANEHGR